MGVGVRSRSLDGHEGDGPYGETVLPCLLRVTTIRLQAPGRRRKAITGGVLEDDGVKLYRGTQTTHERSTPSDLWGKMENHFVVGVFFADYKQM